MRFPNLFKPGNIGECHLKNRIIMPLFPTKYATDSRVNPKMLEFYRATWVWSSEAVPPQH